MRLCSSGTPSLTTCAYYLLSAGEYLTYFCKIFTPLFLVELHTRHNVTQNVECLAQNVNILMNLQVILCHLLMPLICPVMWSPWREEVRNLAPTIPQSTFHIPSDILTLLRVCTPTSDFLVDVPLICCPGWPLAGGRTGAGVSLGLVPTPISASARPARWGSSQMWTLRLIQAGKSILKLEISAFVICSV